MAKRRKKTDLVSQGVPYDGLVGQIAKLLEQSRRTAARSVNYILTATYWEVGRQIVGFEQGGQTRAEYGAELLERLSADLTARFGRAFSRVNLQQMRLFSLGWEIFADSVWQFRGPGTAAGGSAGITGRNAPGDAW